MLNDARDRNAAKVAAAILPILQKQFKHIQRTVIRKGGNLRKVMGKIEVPAEFTTDQAVLYKAFVLLRLEKFNPNHDELGRFAEGEGGGKITLFQGREVAGSPLENKDGLIWASNTQDAAQTHANVEDVYYPNRPEGQQHTQVMHGEIRNVEFNIQNPMTVSYTDTLWDRSKEKAVIDRAKQGGYDSVIIEFPTGKKDYVVWDGSKARIIQKVYKADSPLFQTPLPPPPQPKDDSWDAWKAALIIALLAALGNSADDIGGVESSVWESRGYGSLQFNPDQVVQDYQDRIGRNISNIPDDTLAGVQAAIAAWYTSDAPFSDLVDELGKWFDEARAGLIARTEVGNLTSQITLEAMKFFGFTDWIWDAILDDRTCDFCTEQHGQTFHAGDPMPPEAAHISCRCEAVPVELEERRGE
jgi:SPP1 gp7 family putative phage head morphogenesis protein